MILGYVSPEGTERFRKRHPEQMKAGHFRRAEGTAGVEELWLSSIGIGTYLGEPDAATDRAYTQAIVAAVRGGVNVLDTAINYRHQRSERNIGSALQQLIASGELQRDEVLVCTKAGFLSFDAEQPPDPREYFMREYVAKGILDPQQVVGMHCMAPEYLADQIERSRRNLGLDTIDVFYVHNPETQVGSVPGEVFQQRLQAAFAMLEDAVRAGKIRWYGTATWSGYRVPPGQKGYMPLEVVVGLAQQAGGKDHHFRFVQLPFNLGMPEAYGLKNQSLNGSAMSFLEAAKKLGIAVIASGTLSQGQLTEGLPEFLSKKLGMNSDAQNAIQFTRSAPGIATALIGMSSAKHVEENLKVGEQSVTESRNWKELFRR